MEPLLETTQGADIRAERVRHRLTQQDLAERLGVLRSTVVEAEQDKFELSRREFARWLAEISDIARQRAERESQSGIGPAMTRGRR